MPLSQSHRAISVSTPLGEDVLLLRGVTGAERLGAPFAYELDLVSEDVDILPGDLLGKTATISLRLPRGGKRFFNGHISRFSHVGFDGANGLYRATLVPWLWLLSRTSDCRIFQEQAVPDIIKGIFREHGFTDFEEHLSGSYRTWNYCVQYRETCLDFVTRLMEQEGIYYYFRHEDGKHTLVLADSYSAHKVVEGYEEIPYFPPDETSLREREHLSDWAIVSTVCAGAFAHTDYDFTAPKKNLLAKRASPKDHAFADLERYDFPGSYRSNADGENYARIRLEELQVDYEGVNAEGNVRGLASGALFTLTGYRREDQNREYLILSTDYVLRSDPFGSAAEMPEDPIVQCRITAIDAQTPFRPARVTAKPVVQGIQTATVVGKEGERIWTDKYGRVKVQFHWDRYSVSNENSSCWVRVSQNWAGKTWGGTYMPHIGQEVLINFLEGDPDQPIVTGRVYNQDNMPPEKLPEHQTQSVWRDHGGNETIMEGTEGKQFIHTQQSCGNELLMDGSSGNEKIELRDKYGNEVILDAVAGTITIHSPSHESKIVLGKSIEASSLSDLIERFQGNWEADIVGSTKIKVGADVTEVFVGAQHKTILGSVTKLISPHKGEAIFGWENKVIGGRKSEYVKGSVVKGHWGTEMKLGKSKQADKAPFLIHNLGKAYYSVKGVVAQKMATWRTECEGKAYTKAQDIYLDAGGDMDFKGGVHKISATEAFEEYETMMCKADDWKVKASNAKINAKMNVKDGTLVIK